MDIETSQCNLLENESNQSQTSILHTKIQAKTFYLLETITIIATLEKPDIGNAIHRLTFVRIIVTFLQLKPVKLMN